MSLKQRWGTNFEPRAAGARADAPLTGAPARAGRHRQEIAPADNERLEYLGDAVLGLVVAEMLFAMHPEWREGELTRIRSGLVSRQHMAKVARRLTWASICVSAAVRRAAACAAEAPCSRIPWKL